MPISVPQIYVPGPGDGSSITVGTDPQSLPGSGYAVPGGLECAFEYNGLFLNVQQNLDRYAITDIDAFDADIRDTRDDNTNSDGETPYNSFYGGRTIVLTGTIKTYTLAKLRDMQMALRGAFATLSTEYPLYYRTGDYTKDHYINCKKTSSITSSEQQQNNEMSRDFQITLRASNPRFLSFYSQFLTVQPPVPVLESSPLLLGTVQNSGNYIAEPIIQIWGPSNSGCTITNAATGDSFTIEPPIGYGDYFIFDTRTPSPSLQDNFGNDVWNQLSDDSVSMTLQGTTPETDGNNDIFYYGDVSQVRITWQNSWI